jgi:UDP-N-acetylglucosamine 2-epimerase (non-hydrolysing)
MIKVVVVAGARPNFIKIAPLIREMDRVKGIDYDLVNTGQHYDKNMAGSFYHDLNIPDPDYNLNVGGVADNKQVSMIIERFDEYCSGREIDLVVVVGDVNSTMACALVAVKHGIKVAHIEAGIRSFDKGMPEEINRMVTDAVSDWFYAPSQDAVINLLNEGHKEQDIYMVGNIMIDTLVNEQERIDKSNVLYRLGIEKKDYACITLHRAANVDGKKELKIIIKILNDIQNKIAVVFPVHPRTKKRMDEYGLTGRMNDMPGLIMTDPLGYHDFNRLVKNAKVVLTDSGGIQEETTVYGVPCITLRENTERPVTVLLGTNKLAGIAKKKICEYLDLVLQNKWPTGRIPELWDGKTSQRIVDLIKKIV